MIQSALLTSWADVLSNGIGRKKHGQIAILPGPTLSQEGKNTMQKSIISLLTVGVIAISTVTPPVQADSRD